MVSKKRIRTYFAKRWKKLIKNFRAILQSPETEGLHELRVETKKLRAVASLVNQAKGKNGSLSVKPMKPLIRQTGTIREAELYLKNLDGYTFGENELEQEQIKNVESGYITVHDNQKSYKSGIKAVKKRFGRSARRLKNKDVRAYVDSVINQLMIHLFWPIDTGQLHEARKKIKNLIYTVGMLPDHLQQKINLNVKYLHQLQELIGQWHDLHLTLQLLISRNLYKEPVYFEVKAKEAALLGQVKQEAEYFDSKVIVSNYTRRPGMPAHR